MEGCLACEAERREALIEFSLVRPPPMCVNLRGAAVRVSVAATVHEA